jgi:predicted dehydrogenase
MTIPSIKTPLIGKLFKTRYVLPVFYLLLLALFTGLQIWDIVAVSFFTQVFIWRFIIKSALILVTLVLLAVAVPLAAGGFKAISRTDKTIKKVVVAGCKGEWAQQQYLPYLLNKAVKGEIELWGVDRGDKYETDSQGIFSKKWAAAENCGRVRYLNIADKHFNALIPNEIDLVFVLTPDDTHCSTAEFWFPRLSEEGKIYIEKPLDVKIEDAQRLFAQAGSTAKIFGFDHYLVRIRPLLKKINALAMANGGVKSLAIHILEPNPVKKNRTETLKHGVIFDLYSHVLAVLPALLTEDKAKIAWKINDIEINEVKSLKYAEWQYKSETWARIQLKLDDIEGEAEVGKGVAKLDKHLKIIFRNNKSKYFNLAKNAKARLIKTYLEAVLQGNKAEDIPGVLDSNAAFEILKKLVETKNKSNIAGVYNNTGDKPDSQL